MKDILVTGAAGFIGFHAARALLAQGYRVIGIDNLNSYYDVALKQARLDVLTEEKAFSFHQIDLADAAALAGAMKGYQPTHVLHLAAQAGVRYSLENPRAYVDSNVMGHLNILEWARHSDSLEHLVYASSSSLYGERKDAAFTEMDSVHAPASLYAATKISAEMLSESYHNLYGIPQTGLRFFTVYGPWGRPDMAYFLFVDKILKGEPITLYAPEENYRDFTYIDDIISVMPDILQSPPEAGHAIYNLGNSRPHSLTEFVAAIEQACGRSAEKIISEKQKGDVSHTYADISAAYRDFSFSPKTSLETGLSAFVDWYRTYTN